LAPSQAGGIISLWVLSFDRLNKLFLFSKIAQYPESFEYLASYLSAQLHAVVDLIP
jgi:hypothetical protein